MMTKKTFVRALIVSIGLFAGSTGCHGKKPATTPATDKAMEHKDDATGGATYGGQPRKPTTDAEPGKQSANPCAPH